MNGFLNDRTRLYLGILFVIASIGFFIYGWMERSVGNPFNQIWMLAIIILMGGMVHLQKIGGSRKKSRPKDE